jgi:hypothetical protein
MFYHLAFENGEIADGLIGTLQDFLAVVEAGSHLSPTVGTLVALDDLAGIRVESH